MGGNVSSEPAVPHRPPRAHNPLVHRPAPVQQLGSLRERRANRADSASPSEAYEEEVRGTGQSTTAHDVLGAEREASRVGSRKDHIHSDSGQQAPHALRTSPDLTREWQCSSMSRERRQPRDVSHSLPVSVHQPRNTNPVSAPALLTFPALPHAVDDGDDELETDDVFGPSTLLKLPTLSRGPNVTRSPTTNNNSGSAGLSTTKITPSVELGSHAVVQGAPAPPPVPVPPAGGDRGGADSGTDSRASSSKIPPSMSPEPLYSPPLPRLPSDIALFPLALRGRGSATASSEKRSPPARAISPQWQVSVQLSVERPAAKVPQPPRNLSNVSASRSSAGGLRFFYDYLSDEGRSSAMSDCVADGTHNPKTARESSLYDYGTTPSVEAVVPPLATRASTTPRIDDELLPLPHARKLRHTQWQVAALLHRKVEESRARTRHVSHAPPRGAAQEQDRAGNGQRAAADLETALSTRAQQQQQQQGSGGRLLRRSSGKTAASMQRLFIEIDGEDPYDLLVFDDNTCDSLGDASRRGASRLSSQSPVGAGSPLLWEHPVERALDNRTHLEQWVSFTAHPEPRYTAATPPACPSRLPQRSQDFVSNRYSVDLAAPPYTFDEQLDGIGAERGSVEKMRARSEKEGNGEEEQLVDANGFTLIVPHLSDFDVESFSSRSTVADSCGGTPRTPRGLRQADKSSPPRARRNLHGVGYAGRPTTSGRVGGAGSGRAVTVRRAPPPVHTTAANPVGNAEVMAPRHATPASVGQVRRGARKRLLRDQRKRLLRERRREQQQLRAAQHQQQYCLDDGGTQPRRRSASSLSDVPDMLSRPDSNDDIRPAGSFYRGGFSSFASPALRQRRAVYFFYDSHPILNIPHSGTTRVPQPQPDIIDGAFVATEKSRPIDFVQALGFSLADVPHINSPDWDAVIPAPPEEGATPANTSS